MGRPEEGRAGRGGSSRKDELTTAEEVCGVVRVVVDESGWKWKWERENEGGGGGEGGKGCV